MFDKLEKIFKKSPRLSEVPDLISVVPGTGQAAVSAATKKKYGEIVERMIDFFQDDRPINEISRQDFAAFHDWLAERGTKVVTTNGYRRRARAVWNRLKNRGYPVCDIEGITKMLPRPLQKSKAIEDDHLARVLQVASVRDAALVLYMVGSGIRRQTVPRLTVANTKIWQGMDTRYRIASKIPQEKTSAPRVVYGDHQVALAVMTWLEIREYQESEWLFYSLEDGSQLSVSSVNTIFRKLKERAGLPGYASFHPHALRHTFAQDMLDEHDAKTVSQWMGISVETLLSVYAYRSQQDLAFKRFGDNIVPADLFATGQ